MSNKPLSLSGLKKKSIVLLIESHNFIFKLEPRVDLQLKPYKDFFISANLFLRPIFPYDAQDMYEVYADSSHIKYLGDGNTIEKEQLIKNFTNQAVQTNMDFNDNQSRRHDWTIITYGGIAGKAGLAKSSDSNIGRETIELSYLIAPNFGARGLTTEAAKLIITNVPSLLNLESIEIFATAHPKNKASVRVLEKIGFKRNEEMLNIPKYGQIRDYYFTEVSEVFLECIKSGPIKY